MTVEPPGVLGEQDWIGPAWPKMRVNRRATPLSKGPMLFLEHGLIVRDAEHRHRSCPLCIGHNYDFTRVATGPHACVAPSDHCHRYHEASAAKAVARGHRATLTTHAPTHS
jgi:hypothetical protein